VVVPRTLARNGWTGRHVVFAAAVVLAAVVLTLDAWISMARMAVYSSAACHMLLVPLVAGWLVHVRRQRMRFCKPRGAWVGLLILTLGCLTYIAGQGGLLSIAWYGGAVLILIGCLIAVSGIDTLRHFAPAYIVLLFLIPIPQQLGATCVAPLQAATADITQVIYGAFGAGFARYGDVVMSHGTKLTVVGSADVLGVTLASIVICYGFAFRLPLRPWARILVMVSSPVSALLCNVVRAVGTAWIYSNYDSDRFSPLLQISSWASVVVALAVLTVLIRLLIWASLPIRRYTLAYDT
jgi:exosortase